MSNYRFQLEKYTGLKSRYHCPNCNQKQFVRYVDNQTNMHINSKVGRCNREEKCGYHFTPKQYFCDHEIPKINNTYISKKIIKSEKIFYFDKNSVKRTTGKKVELSNLYKFLQTKFDDVSIKETFHKYLVGTSCVWNNSTVFWQIDTDLNIRAGKIMCYNGTTGRRDKKRFNWYKTPEGFKTEQCFFGAHLLNNAPAECNIGIVESEKTALICDMFFKDKFVWLSSCGLHGLSQSKFLELGKRKITLFPDLSIKGTKNPAFEIWCQKAKSISKNLNIDIRISTFLSKNTTVQQKEDQWDLADFILHELLIKNNLKLIQDKKCIPKVIAS